MVLLSSTSEYIPLVESAGFRLSIHNQTEQPFPETFGVNIEYGTTTSIGVRYVSLSSSAPKLR